MRKQLLAILAACVLGLGALCACSGQAASSAASGSASSQAAKIRVVCATFPAYDWVMQVLGDHAEACDVVYLLGNGVDVHSYQPSVEDIAKIADADLFVYVGGESDKWADDAVKAAGNSGLHTVNMLQSMGDAALEEEVVEGMQADEAHDHDHASGAAADADHGSGEAREYDEHVWLSLQNAQVLVDAIAVELGEIDSTNADAYRDNAQAYKAQLAELDKRFAAAAKAAGKDTLVFADRFPFLYLVHDYDLKYFAAFEGCSAETEASFETVAFLAKKVDDLGLSSVLVIEGSDHRIADTVVQNTQAKNQQVLVMDSLQSVSDADVAAGKTYLGAMQDNLAVLETALA